MKNVNNYTFFWKDKIAQWNMKPFTDTFGVEYCCAEQYMMAMKSLLFEDSVTYKKIMDTNNPKEIQELGRKIQNFIEETWDEHKETIVINGNYYKFSQNNDLLDILMSTNNSILVEASPYDKIWGVGLSVENPDILDENKWKGKNLLGKCLMKVRELLKED